MLYKKNKEEKLSLDLFKSPTAEYRGAPFWAWNCELDRDELLRQIDVFNEMGLGGFHMHVRSGMATEYLSDEFMDLIRACAEKAEKERKEMDVEAGSCVILNKTHINCEKFLNVTMDKST